VAVVVVASPEEHQEEGAASVLVDAVVLVSPAEAAVDSRGEHQEDGVVSAGEGVKLYTLQDWESGVLVTCLFQDSGTKVTTARECWHILSRIA